MLITLCILAMAVLLMVTNRVRGDLVAMLVVLGLLLSGVLDVNESLSGFSNPVVIIIACMFIISEAVVHTGIAQRLGETVLVHGGHSETKMLIMLMATSCLLGSFMSSTATAAIFIPITLAVAEKAEINHKRLLIPLAAASLISGMMTLVATTPNIVVNNALRRENLETLTFFSFTPFGMVILMLGIGFMAAIGRHLLAPRTATAKRKQQRSIEELIDRYGINHRFALLCISPDSELIDRSVARMQLGARHHIHLIALQTGTDSGRSILPARPDSVFQAGDRLVILGEPDPINRFIAAFSLEKMALPTDPILKKRFFQVIGIGEVMLTPDSDLIGKSIRQIRFHTQFHSQVLAIRRKGKTITVDIADEPLRFGDVLLMCGAWEDILRLRQHRDQYILLNLPQDYHEVVPGLDRAPLALGLLAVMIGLLVVDLVPTVTAILGTTVALILTGCVRPNSCYKVIDWPTILLLAGILPLATALEKTGVTAQMTQGVLALFGNSSPLLVLAMLFAITVVIGLFLSNSPTAVLAAPMAIDIGQAMGISPQACAMTVAIACSAAFISPLGSPVNMIVREPGGYGFADYAKVGVPLVAISMAATVLLTWLIYL
jgi:di/tricarboxylate transporter